MIFRPRAPVVIDLVSEKNEEVPVNEIELQPIQSSVTWRTKYMHLHPTFAVLRQVAKQQYGIT